MCLIPVVLLGYLLTLHPNMSHVTSLDAAVVQAQTCERGPGIDIKFTSDGLGAVAAQYGFHQEHGLWSWTFSPKVGGAALPYSVPELSTQYNFSLGAQAMIGYDQGRLSLEYWHMSNAGLGSTNAGLDLLSVTTGIVLY